MGYELELKKDKQGNPLLIVQVCNDGQVYKAEEWSEVFQTFVDCTSRLLDNKNLLEDVWEEFCAIKALRNEREWNKDEEYFEETLSSLELKTTA